MAKILQFPGAKAAPVADKLPKGITAPAAEPTIEGTGLFNEAPQVGYVQMSVERFQAIFNALAFYGKSGFDHGKQAQQALLSPIAPQPGMVA